MKKQVIAALLCLSMAAAIGACGNSTKDSSESSGTSESSDSQESESGTDSSSSDEEAEFPDYSRGLTEEGFIADVTALDHIKLGEYKGLKLDPEEIEVTDEMFQEYMDELMAEFEEEVEVTDRAVEDDDIVNIDFVGKIDGEEFEGGSSESYNVRIGVTSFIDDFIEQLKGHEIEETFDIEVTFPDSYPQNEELAGKDAVFTITINSIKELITPECDDAFVEENYPEYDNAEAFLEAQREEYALSVKKNYAWPIALENAELISYPEDYRTGYLEEQVKYYRYMAAVQGTTLDDMLSYYSMTEEEFMEELGGYADEDVKAMLVVQAICETEGLKVEDEDVERYLGIPLEEASTIISMYGKGYLYQNLLLQKAAQFIVDNAVEGE